MSEETVVALDCMGGDNAPHEIVKGAINAVSENGAIKVLLFGEKSLIEDELSKYNLSDENKARLEIVNASEKIETAEHPVQAITHKKDSSMVLALKAVKEGRADAVCSAGNSGALLAGGQLIVGRIKGIKRAPFAPVIPTAKGPALLLDAGANMDSKPEWLVQYAMMGSIYAKHVLKIDNPRVAIVNVGAEEEKGNSLIKETYPLLKELKGINFIGSIEARDIASGYADVIVCDAFIGNVIVKMFEGVASTFLSLIKKSFKRTILTKIGALLSIKSLKSELKKFDATRYGGAPMLGLNGLVVKTHGNATCKEISIALKQCMDFKETKINNLIKENINIED